MYFYINDLSKLKYIYWYFYTYMALTTYTVIIPHSISVKLKNLQFIFSDNVFNLYINKQINSLIDKIFPNNLLAKFQLFLKLDIILF